MKHELPNVLTNRGVVSKLPEEIQILPEKIWRNWVDESIRTQDIQVYLNTQNKIFQNIVKIGSYQSVVEAGCANGTFLLESAIRMGCNYVGIDISQDAVDNIKKSINNWKKEIPTSVSAQAIHGDICNISSLIPAEILKSSKGIIVFPFNLFGGILCCDKILDDIYSLDLDVLIFSYDISSKANNMREEYYKKCGFKNLKRQKFDRFGVLYYSEESFFSFAYDPYMVMGWLEKSGYTVREIIEFQPSGVAYFGSAISLQTHPTVIK